MFLWRPLLEKKAGSSCIICLVGWGDIASKAQHCPASRRDATQSPLMGVKWLVTKEINTGECEWG